MKKTARFSSSQFLLAFVFFIPIFITTVRVVFNSNSIKISESQNYSTDEKRDLSSTFEADDQIDKEMPEKKSELQNYLTDEKRDIYSTFESDHQSDQGLPIDPFDLMHRLRKAGTMKDATTPSDALDEALNAFDQSEYKNVPIE